MIPFFAVACFCFETVKIYPEKARLGQFRDCGVHWLAEGEHQACSSAPDISAEQWGRDTALQAALP